MKASDKGIRLIQEFEGFSPSAYLDQNGVPTIGYGHTKGVRLGDTCSIAQADQWLSEDVGDAESAVCRLVKVPLTQNQFDALVSLAYNIGAEHFAKSTVLRELNQNQYLEASSAIPMWNKTNGEVNSGLVRRREEERKLFLTPPGGSASNA